MKQQYSMSVSLAFALLWLPAAGIAGDVTNQSTPSQETAPKSDPPSASKETAGKKSQQSDVQSRGLFKKKKKKQKGGSASHSQASEQTEEPAPLSKP
jgi:hypothetical protein